MGTIGPLGGSVFVDDAGNGTVAWASPGNAVAVDQVYATATLVVSNHSHFLIATGFGFQIPLDATVVAIKADVLASATVNLDVTDDVVKLCKAGAPVGSDKHNGNNINTSDLYKSYGDSISDLWGTTWTPTEVNASGFGLAYSAICVAGAAILRVDYIRITVVYLGSNRVGGPFRHSFGWGS